MLKQFIYRNQLSGNKLWTQCMINPNLTESEPTSGSLKSGSGAQYLPPEMQFASVEV